MTQPPGRPMVPEDLFRIRFVSDPQLHPDARRVAFVVTMLSEARDEYLSTIWVVDVNGGDARPFTRGPRRDTAPRWSPDGRWLAFVSEREKKGKGQLHVMPADGGEPVRLTDLRPGVTSPAWSPDGRWLAFVSRVGGWEEPTDEEERERSKPPRIIDVLKYKSNGVGFVYDRPEQVFVVSAEGGPARQLTVGAFDSHHPAWAPDGQRRGVRVRPPRGARRGRRGRRLHGARRGRGGAPAHADRGAGVVAGLLAGRPDGRLRRAHRRARGLPSPPPVRGSRGRGRAGLPDRGPRSELRADDGRGGSPVAREHGGAPVPGRGRGRRAPLPGPAAGGEPPEPPHRRDPPGDRLLRLGRRRLRRFHRHGRPLAPGGLRVPGRRDRRAPADGSEPGLEGGGRAGAPRALPVRARGLQRRRLGDAARSGARRAGATRRSSTFTAGPRASTATASSTSSRSTRARATPSCTSTLEAAAATTRRSRGRSWGTGAAATTPT